MRQKEITNILLLNFPPAYFRAAVEWRVFYFAQKIDNLTGGKFKSCPHLLSDLFSQVSIVVVFVFCHTYRLTLRAYELANPEKVSFDHFRHCDDQGRFNIPVAMHFLSQFHYLFLVSDTKDSVLVPCWLLLKTRLVTTGLNRPWQQLKLVEQHKLDF